MTALIELEKAYRETIRDRRFREERDAMLREYAGRPTPLYFARRLTEKGNGAKIFLKREDLAFTGSHKINNTLGQGLLARRMGKKRIRCARRWEFPVRSTWVRKMSNASERMFSGCGFSARRSSRSAPGAKP